MTTDIETPGMTPWLRELVAAGARVEAHRVIHFGAPSDELQAARLGPVISDLSQLGLICAAGADVNAFLQGQLSSDIRQLDGDHAQVSSYNSPKGRVLATLLLFRIGELVFLQLPRELAEPIRKRLSMFVLRSKVQLTDASGDFVRFGVAGQQAERLVTSVLGTAPSSTLEVTHGDGCSAIRLPGDRFELVASPVRGPVLWRELETQARPAGAPAWDWLEIQAGIPTITLPTQDRFVAQMINLERIGGVSFQKGCYPGQEIVARTQYLGAIKRRAYLAHVSCDPIPAPGHSLFSADLGEQPSGTVLNAAPAPGGGFDLLAVIQVASAQGEPIHLGAPSGPVLELRPLPYPLA
jgi:folate-binding protein YgfZ